MDDALRRSSAFADRALENTRGVAIIIGVLNDVQLSPVSEVANVGPADGLMNVFREAIPTIGNQNTEPVPPTICLVLGVTKR